MSTFSRSAATGTRAAAHSVVNFRHGIIAAALLAICAWPGFGLAQDTDPASRFSQVTDAPLEVSKSFVPGFAKIVRPVQIVVIMSADSVASVRARTPLHAVAKAQADSIQSQALAQQEAIKPMLERHGARVLAQYQHALNGIKVEVDSSKISTLAALPGVVSVHPVGTYNRTNAISVPFIGAPLVWQGIPGFRGEGVKIAVIDTGIDYTHANFGGPGTVAAYNAAFATNTLPANPTFFGPNAPKVKGGTDLVGDDYDADPNHSTYQPVPHPDPNPLDCRYTSGSVGHGSHTAGTAAGFGVLNGATYTGPYNSAAYQQHFDIGPGVAPRADIYSVRVFGCNGSTNVVVDAIDWAVANGMDVINMSLGSDFGDANTSDAIAAHNAVLAGITVVASSGNAGPGPYITGSPAAGNGVITAAAMDAHATFPGAKLALTGNPNPITVQDSNGASFADGTQYPIIVLRNANGTVSLGCNPAEYDPTQGGVNVTGKLVVTVRGTCARVFRAGAAQHFGAAAAAMIDTSASSYPPFEGPIAGGAPDPGTGNIYEPVTIPFFGVLRTDTTALTGPTGGPAPATATATNTTIANPSFGSIASFSSGGPRYGDSFFQPSLSAPGVSVFSTASGTGNAGQFLSGTSMSAPHIAGVAALVRQAHRGDPAWNEMAQRAAITQTADRSQIVGYSARLAGNGLAQPLPATQTQAVVLGTPDAAEPLSLGFVELTTSNYSNIKNIDIRNNGTSPITFNAKVTQAGGVPHFVAPFGPTVTVPAQSDVQLPIKISVPIATIGPADVSAAIKDLAGTLTLTPTSASQNAGVSLNVPYYLVPRARSLITVTHNVPSVANPTTTLTVNNGPASLAGTADFYAWGLSGTRQGIPYADTRAVGVQSFGSGATTTLVFAINTFTRFSNAAANEWDINIDINGDGIPDYQVVGADLGALTTGVNNGQLAAAVFNLSTGAGIIRFLGDAPTDGTTILLPVRASDLGLSSANPRFSYQARAFSVAGGSEQVGGTAKFNAFTPAISTGQFVSVDPNGTAPVSVSINPVEWALTPALGVMAVAIENLNGTPQADLIPISPSVTP